MNENLAGCLSLNVTITGTVETKVVTVKAAADSLAGELITNVVNSFQLEDRAIESLKAFKDDFELKVHHSLKLDGVHDGDCLVLTVGQVTSLYFERQVAPDTCFRHALNHYTQKSYANPSFLELYKKLLSPNFEKIFEVKMEHMNTSFYGDLEVPTGKLEEKSAPELDEDLNGYYTIYMASSPDMFLEDLEESGVKELSPDKALFLLEFQMETIIDADGNEVHILKHVPHRFYHRFAWTSDLEDRSSSTERWIQLLQNEHKDSPKIFFAHIQTDCAHAFAASRAPEGEDKWLLLDSMLPNPRRVNSSNELMNVTTYGGRASVMILQDMTRPVTELYRLVVNK